MDSLTATAASGLRSRIETLELVANNIANAGTAGFKADYESYNLYFGDSAWEGYGEGRPAAAEMPVVQKNWTDFSQGLLTSTGNPLDLALASKGFFGVNTPNGALYTRNGHFRISKDGRLETLEGYAVRNSEGLEIRLDPSLDFNITKAGSIRQGGATIAQLEIVELDQKSTPKKQGVSYYSFSPDGIKNTPDPEILQGQLESSNIGSAGAAVKLVNVMRQFEMLQRAVTIAADMNRKTFEEVARINS